MSYNPKYIITDHIREHLQEIEKLKSIVANSRILPTVEASVRHRATIEAAHSSTSIEGNPLNPREVRAVLTTDKPLTKAEYAELEVKNYKRALDYIDERRQGNQPITIDDILRLHTLIMDGLITKNRVGKWRFNEVFIENNATHEVIYSAAPVAKVPSAMSDLLTWVTENQFSLHPVIIAAVLHLHFVAIHPFADGNGRTARACTALYLALNHADNNGSLVLDTYYATDRKAYYNVLQLVNGPNYSTSLKNDFTPWLEYFVEGYLSSLHVLDAEIRMLSLATLGHDAKGLDRDAEDILSYVAKFGTITISEAEAMLPEVNRRALQRKLKQLVDDGYLALIGSTHDAKYILKND